MDLLEYMVLTRVSSIAGGNQAAYLLAFLSRHETCRILLDIQNSTVVRHIHVLLNSIKCSITTLENPIKQEGKPRPTMSTGLIFVTAPEADYKLINLMLLQIRDWEYGAHDRFKIVTTKNAYDLESDSAETSPPLSSSSLDNAWAGAALEDVEGFCLDLARDVENLKRNLDASLYVVVDSAGAQAHSCILGRRAHSYDEEEDVVSSLDRFDKMRVPWEKLYVPWCNLDIANMDFEDFTLEADDGGEGEDGWFTFKAVMEGDDPTKSDDLSDESRGKRDREVQRFRDAGHI